MFQRVDRKIFVCNISEIQDGNVKYKRHTLSVSPHCPSKTAVLLSAMDHM